MSYSSPTLDLSLTVLNGAPFDLHLEAFGKGETERCVETPFAAQTLAKSDRVLDIGLAAFHGAVEFGCGAPEELGKAMGVVVNRGCTHDVSLLSPWAAVSRR